MAFAFKVKAWLTGTLAERAVRGEREIIPEDDRLLSRWLVNHGPDMKYWCFLVREDVGEILAKLIM